VLDDIGFYALELGGANNLLGVDVEGDQGITGLLNVNLQLVKVNTQLIIGD
jgi:hypothetical protein